MQVWLLILTSLATALCTAVQGLFLALGVWFPGITPGFLAAAQAGAVAMLAIALWLAFSRHRLQAAWTATTAGLTLALANADLPSGVLWFSLAVSCVAIALSAKRLRRNPAP